MTAELQIDRVAVIGAGVMGAQIAATLANAGLQVDLLDLELDGDPAGLAKQGLDRAAKARPPAFFIPDLAARIRPGGLDDLKVVAAADWVVEAIVEQFEPKRALLERLEGVVGADAVISSNTSGLSISSLVQGRSERFASRFLGTHFFNPPRYMKLVEVVPGAATREDLMPRMRAFLTTMLGKKVVLARDTPNFIANRLGIFAIMDLLHRMDREELTVEQVDGLTGPLLGRPRSATLRLCDVIGLDTLGHVARTGYENLPDHEMRDRYLPSVLFQRMLDAGLLGTKAGGGFYRKIDSKIQAIDLQSLEYRDLVTPEYGDLDPVIKTRDLAERLRLLWQDSSAMAAFLRDHMTSVLVYAANNAGEMAADLEQVDRAMRWGFNWEAGPFELWDMIGYEAVLASRKEPPMLITNAENATGGEFYVGEGAESKVLSTSGTSLVSREVSSSPLASATLLKENEGARLFDLGARIGVLQFHCKMNALGLEGLAMAYAAVDGPDFKALVLCGAGHLFSVGANLKLIASMSAAGEWKDLEQYLWDFQNSIRGLQYGPFPVIAAPHGLALGGGCEFCMGADLRLAAAELRMGLVETKVGLIPGGGGCMEMVRKFGADIDPGFQVIFRGQFSDNAHEARSWGLLESEDRITMDEDGLLDSAIAWARELAAAEYNPPEPTELPVAGSPGIERLEAWLDEQEGSKRITPYDRVVGSGAARVLCGGNRQPELVEEGELMALEREVFLKLCGNEGTLQRIDHMLKTGKPLRN